MAGQSNEHRSNTKTAETPIDTLNRIDHRTGQIEGNTEALMALLQPSSSTTVGEEIVERLESLESAVLYLAETQKRSGDLQMAIHKLLLATDGRRS